MINTSRITSQLLASKRVSPCPGSVTDRIRKKSLSTSLSFSVLITNYVSRMRCNLLAEGDRRYFGSSSSLIHILSLAFPRSPSSFLLVPAGRSTPGCRSICLSFRERDFRQITDLSSIVLITCYRVGMRTWECLEFIIYFFFFLSARIKRKEGRGKGRRQEKLCRTWKSCCRNNKIEKKEKARRRVLDSYFGQNQCSFGVLR